MASLKHNSVSEPARIKATVISRGLKLADIAGEAGMAVSSLSNYISGRRTNFAGQQKIFEAFCRLTGRRPTVEGLNEFWHGCQRAGKGYKKTA